MDAVKPASNKPTFLFTSLRRFVATEKVARSKKKSMA
jgi:hypothetical protein